MGPFARFVAQRLTRDIDALSEHNFSKRIEDFPTAQPRVSAVQ
jgi:hypothetical protein